MSMFRIFTNSFDVLRGFYEDVMEFPVDYEDDHIAIFDTGPCKLGIEPGRDAAEASTSLFTGISFETDAIDAAVATLREKGVTIIGEPAKQYWGGTLAHFNDPEGNTITLVEYPKSVA